MVKLLTYRWMTVCMFILLSGWTWANEATSSASEQLQEPSQMQAQEPIRVVFWTNQTLNGPISIYYNGHYVGQITRRYASAPSCGAKGCVTITVSGRNNTWYGVSQNGVKWYSDRRTLSAGCTRIRLYSSGAPSRKPGTTSTPRGNAYESSSSAQDQWKIDFAREASDKVLSGWGSVMEQGLNVSQDGVPFFGLDLGLSVFYGEFVRANFTTGGMTGFIVYGGIGKDWLFKERRMNSQTMTWHVGAGMRFSTQADHFHLGLAFGENPLSVNYGLLCEFVYHRYFGYYKRWGFVIGAGAGLGDVKAKKPKRVWDVQVGLAVKLWQR